MRSLKWLQVLALGALVGAALRADSPAKNLFNSPDDTPAGTAQEQPKIVQPPRGRQTFAGSADVVAVEIPVQVVRAGEPVRGLTADDFEVYDGRKKQAITGFEVLDLGTPEAATPAAEIPVAGRRHFLLLFDLTFSEPKSIVRARSAAQKILDQLHPTDLVAVATYSSLQGANLVLGFTSDRSQAEIALETLGVPSLIERSRDPLKLGVVDAKKLSASHMTGGGTLSVRWRRSYGARLDIDRELVSNFQSLSVGAEQTERDKQASLVQRLAGSFSQLARLMGGLAGRKYVVYLSQGYDSTLLSGTTDVETQRAIQESSIFGEAPITADSNERFGDTTTANRVEKMLIELRRADCIIQAVNISGLRAEGDQGPRMASGNDSLLQMAKDTGGELFENFNDLEAALGRMLKDTSVTYVLTIQPDDLEPGDYRRLKVELKGASRGARLVHRQGYYAPKSYAQRNPLERLLEAGSQILGEERDAVKTAVLAAPFRMAEGPSYVPVLVEVDGPSLLAGKQEAQLPIEVYVYALDESGAVIDFLSQTVALELARAEPVLRLGGFKFFGHLDLEPGRYSLRVLVRNGTNGISGLKIVALEVPAFGAVPVLLPAFFPDGSNRWLLAREVQGEGARQVEYPFMRGDQPYVPSSLPVMKPGQETPVSLVGYNLAPGSWKAEAKVLSLDGQQVHASGGLKIVSARPGTEGAAARAEGSFRAPTLPPGHYLLKVTLTDGSGVAGSSVSPFRLEASAM